jgi:uncharacterized protein
MTPNDLIAETESFIRERQSNEGTGHDWHHTDRVRKMAMRIAAVENADPAVVELGALLHDIADHKFHSGDSTVGANAAREFLQSKGADPQLIDQVCHIVEHISFKGAGEPNTIASLEGRIVQDADRLDAMGAIGIARCFAFGGHKNRPLYDPAGADSSLRHFYDKLLLLKDRMNTKTGREIAEERHQFLETYLEKFMKEWDGGRLD